MGCCEHTGVQPVWTALPVSPPATALSLPPPLTHPWSRGLQWTGLPLLWKKAAVLQTIGHPAGVWSMWLGARSVATQWLGLGTMSSVCIRTHVYGQNCPLRVWLAVQGCTGHTLHRYSYNGYTGVLSSITSALSSLPGWLPAKRPLYHCSGWCSWCK